MIARKSVVAFVAAALLGGCGGAGGGGDADTGTETEGGAGGDADADADGDADTDTGPVSTGAPIWNARGDGLGVAHRVAFAGDGGLAVVGVFQGTIDFGAGAMTSAGGNDAFVARFDAGGSCLWSRRYGGSGNDSADDVAFDVSDDAVVAGYYVGEATLDDGPLPAATGLSALAVALPDGVGTAWIETFGAGYARGVALGPDGEIGLMVEPTGPVDFGGGVLAGGSDALALGVLDSARECVWSRLDDGVTGGDIAFAGNGDLVLAGDFSGTVDLGLGPLDAVASTAGLVARFGAGGGAVFANRIFDGSESLSVYAVAVGPDGEIAVGGISYPWGDAPSAMLVEKLDPDGAPLPGWSLRLGALDYGAANGVAFDPWGNLVVAGLVREGTIDFGCGSIEIPPDPDNDFAGDMALAKLGTDGGCLFGETFGGTGDHSAWGVAAGDGGTIALAGQFQNEVDFGLGPLVATHFPEPCVAVFEP